MKKTFFLFISLLSFLYSLSQQGPPQYVSGPTGFEANTYKARFWLVAPVYADTPTVTPQYRSIYTGAIILRVTSSDSSYFGYNGRRWIMVGSGSGGGSSFDSTSLSNRIDDAFNQIQLLPDSSGLVFVKPNGVLDTVLFANSGGPGSGFDGNAFNQIQLLPDSSGLVFITPNGQRDTILFIVGDASVTDFSFVSTSVNLALNTSHRVVNLTSTGLTITLPSAIGITGKGYTIKLSAAGSGTVATTSGQLIDGAGSYPLSTQYKYLTVVSNGSNWIITSNN